MTTVCFDFGNTRLKYAVFKDRSFDYEGVLPDSEAATIKSLMEEIQPAKTILSSVIEHDKKNRRSAFFVLQVPPVVG